MMRPSGGTGAQLDSGRVHEDIACSSLKLGDEASVRADIEQRYIEVVGWGAVAHGVKRCKVSRTSG